MSRPPFLSPSQWGTWEHCPRKWRHRYIDGLPDPGSIHTVAGKAAHLMLELFMAHEPGDRTPDLREVCLEVALEEHAEEMERLAVDPATVRRWVTESSVGFPVTEPAPPSRARVLHTEQRHTMEVNGVPVLLVLDRVDRVEDRKGVRALPIDYKSGAKIRVETKERRQMILSAIAAEEITGLPATPRAQLRFVRMGEVREVLTGAHARATVAEDILRTWRQITAACLEDDFEARPGALCNWCPYATNDICPQGAREARRYRERKGIA